MSPSPERRAALWRRAGFAAVGGAAVAVVVIASSVWNAGATTPRAGSHGTLPVSTSRHKLPPAALPPHAAKPGAAPPAAHDRTRAEIPAAAPLSATAVETQLAQLAALPPGDEAIALGRQLSASATSDHAAPWRDALLRTTHPAVERVAIAALARTADSAMVHDLARAYPNLPAEQRGRVLRVLEAADNPAALEGLVRTVATDRGERRSALAVSALYGMASLGTVAAIDHLLQQAATDDVDFALMALERVRTRQAVEQIRAAAAGSKDHTQLSASVRGHLRRIASTAEARLADR